MAMRICIAPFFSILLSGCSLIVTGPSLFEQSDRDALIPLSAPVERPVRIYWDDHRIPYIEAESETDLALGIGIVHAHLRGAQLEVFRRVSQGRLAESFGFLAADIDHTLRTMDLDRATKDIIEKMDPQTKAYAMAYVEGLNLTIRKQKEEGLRWPVLEALDMDQNLWTLQELVTVWRLFSVDVNWFRFYQALSAEDMVDPEKSWRNLKEQQSTVASYTNLPQKKRILAGIFLTLSRSGSNSLVVHGSRSTSGKPMIASDPHVGLALPPLWIIMGIKSPGIEAVGFTIPGLPILALGRSRHIAWGGTNMWGLSSALIRLDAKDLKDASSHTENLPIAYWPDREITIRNTQYGPVLSDAPVFDDIRERGYEFAFSWVGHGASDELTTYRRILKARNCEEFRQAFKTWAVSAQNYLCADAEGNIQHILAYRRPEPDTENGSLFRSTQETWKAFKTPVELPFRNNPEQGMLASANDEPEWSDVSVGFFFSPDARRKRMEQLVNEKGRVSIQDLMDLQKDTCSLLAMEGRDRLVELFKGAGLFQESVESSSRAADFPTHTAIIHELEAWDGCYRNGSRGPLIYETIHYSFRMQLGMEPANGEVWQEVMARLEELQKNSTTRFQEVLLQALEEGESLKPDSTWDLRTPVAHILGNIPVLGGAWVFQRLPEDGGSHTVYKRGFTFEDGQARVSYGANARHISSMADPDENYFLLFGGQDGIMRSPTTLDQVELWKEGRMIRIPLGTDKLESWKLTVIEPSVELEETGQ